MQTEKKVIKVEFEAGAKHSKIGKRFIFPVRYVLEDGTTKETAIGRDKLKDLKAEVAELIQLGAPKYETYCCFNESGEYWGTKTTFSLFGG